MKCAGLDFSKDVSIIWPTLLTNDQEMGDTANRVGAFYTCAALLEGRDAWVGRYLTSMDLLECAPGVWRRSPDYRYWYSDKRNFSRDQGNNILCAIIMFKDYARGQRTAKAFQRRFFFSQNTYKNWCKPGDPGCGPKIPDPPTPALFSLLVRASNSWWLWPLMWITDIFIGVDVWMCNRDDHDIPVQLIPVLLATNSRWPTYWSRKWLLSINMQRAHNLLVAYFKYGNNGIENMPALYMKALNTQYWRMK